MTARHDRAEAVAKAIFAGSDTHTSYEYMVSLIETAMEYDSAEWEEECAHAKAHAKQLGDLLARMEERLGAEA